MTRRENADRRGVREKIGAADDIYVGSGDASYVLEVRRARGIDDLLREAWRDGTVISGADAGAICWFAGGLGDVLAVRTVDYRPVSGLDLVSGLDVTPRATPERRDACAGYLSIRGAAGIALEAGTAIEITDDRWRVHTGVTGATAYRVPPGSDHMEVEALPLDGTYRPVSELR